MIGFLSNSLFFLGKKGSPVDFDAVKVKGSIIDSLLLNSSIHSDDEEEEPTHEFQELKTNINQINSNGVNSSDILCPSFTNYLYFLFAPTLVYCDDYPRFVLIFG